MRTAARERLFLERGMWESSMEVIAEAVGGSDGWGRRGPAICNHVALLALT